MINDKTIYQFSVLQLDGEMVSLEKFRNKVLLVVNTASRCGFTPQLKELEILRKEFEGQDFEILAFPSNDFGAQEPLEGNALSKFCRINFNTRYPVFEKVHVKGANAHPLFKFLSSKKLNGRVGSAPRWNFHKYLINKNGEVVNYFYSFTKPTSGKIKDQIQKLLEPIPTLI